LNDIINEVSLEDNKARSKQKFYVAYNYDTKNGDININNEESVPIKKRKINTMNNSNDMNEIIDKKRKMDLDEFKYIRSEINAMPKIPKIKTVEVDRRVILDNNTLQQPKRELQSINNSFKDNGKKIKSISNKNVNEDYHNLKENEISMNNKIYNPKLFELSASLENEINNISTESSIQSEQDSNNSNNDNNIINNSNNNMENCITDNNMKSKFINNNENKIDNAFEKMDSAVFINQ